MATEGDSSVAAESVSANELESEYLRHCARVAEAEAVEAFSVIGAGRESLEQEYLELELDTDLGTRPTVNAVHPRERIRMYSFGPTTQPIVVPLREDFPDTDHLNPAWPNGRRSLCLYDEGWEEVRRTWTPTRYLERIRTWFRRTAYGELHDRWQPLDPLIYGANFHLLMPAAWMSTPLPADVGLSVRRCSTGALVARLGAHESELRDTFVFLQVDGGVHPHGRLRAPPRTLTELLAVDPAIEGAVTQALKEGAMEAQQGEQARLERDVVLLMTTGLQRTASGPVEQHVHQGFVMSSSLGDIGARLGWLARPTPESGSLWTVVVGGDGKRAELDSVGVDCAAIHPELSRERAAEAAGNESSERPITIVGAGALGSQLVYTLAQEGYGRWTIIDGDVLLPHNLARHALDPICLGQEKASMLAMAVQRLLGDESAATAITQRVSTQTEPGDDVRAALGQGELIVDASASVATARRLLLSPPRGVPVVSMFFNPRGTDLVVLGERRDEGDVLGLAEATYYRRVCLDASLSDHLAYPEGRVMPSVSCREPSVQIPQSRVMRLVGRAADAIRTDVVKRGPFITLWCDDEQGQRRAVEEIELRGVEASVDGWLVVAPDDLLDELERHRADSGSTETGGVVCGVWDLTEQMIMLCAAIGPPEDSERSAGGFVRGCRNLPDDVERLGSLTQGMVAYAGEWHTHPPRHSASLSQADHAFLDETSRQLGLDGLPALMLVVGEDGVRVAIKDDGERALATARLRARKT